MEKKVALSVNKLNCSPQILKLEINCLTVMAFKKWCLDEFLNFKLKLSAFRNYAYVNGWLIFVVKWGYITWSSRKCRKTSFWDCMEKSVLLSFWNTLQEYKEITKAYQRFIAYFLIIFHPLHSYWCKKFDSFCFSDWTFFLKEEVDF